jgi:hypothetical protein
MFADELTKSFRRACTICFTKRRPRKAQWDRNKSQKEPAADNEFFGCVKLEKKRHSWIEVLTIRLWRRSPKVDLLRGSFAARNLNHSLLVIPPKVSRHVILSG